MSEARVFEGPDLFEIERLTQIYIGMADVRGCRLFENFSYFVPIPEDLPLDEWVHYTVPGVEQVKIAGMDFNLDIVATVDVSPTGTPLVHTPRSIELQLTHPVTMRAEPFHKVLLWRVPRNKYDQEPKGNFSTYKQLAELLGIDIFELDHRLDELRDRSTETAFWREGAWTAMNGDLLSIETVSSQDILT